MDTSKLKKFAQFARRSLMEQVSAKLRLVLTPESTARREQPRAVAELEAQIQVHGKEQVVEKVAYTWFNRFCAFRFMDVNRYTRIGVVSPAEGQFQPEILAEAKMGHIDEEMVSGDTTKKIFDLLSGTAPSPDAQSEAYRLLVVAACNFWNTAMPFLFQRIDDYTELLMPDDLLSGNSILAYTREAMTPDACEDVEVIGWLYQFYISEKKDEVFDGLKKNKKITPENIPAATQLFTPHWIVRYLVENSLGRLWLLNRPSSKLAEQMDYYIKPEQVETDFLHIAKPEEIKICDPACGSGHMLTYAFDLLYAIYEEEGYESAEIPEKILTNNLYGIEIDERAGELAAFALTMKARAKQRRYFNKKVIPNVCVLRPIKFSDQEIKEYISFLGNDLFSLSLQTILRQFEEADNFGSLIRPALTSVTDIIHILNQKKVSSHLILQGMHKDRVLPLLKQADYLSPKYHVVIANPPYMGGKGMNGRLAAWAKDHFPKSKADIYAMFIERIFDMLKPNGYAGMMTPFTWMFLSSYEMLRRKTISEYIISTLVKPEYHSFFESAYVPICSFVALKQSNTSFKGAFIDLEQFYGADIQPQKLLEAIKNHNCGWFYRVSANDFKKIPGTPFAFWLNENLRKAFVAGQPLSEIAPPKQGLKTGNNDLFLRLWHEVDESKINISNCNTLKAKSSNSRWFFCSKGGAFRKWYGNYEYVLDWEDDGYRIRNYKDVNGRVLSRPQNTQHFFNGGITWSTITVSSLSMRVLPKEFVFESTGSICPIEDYNTQKKLLAFLNSSVIKEVISAISPTLNYGEGSIGKLPFLDGASANTNSINTIIEVSRKDWDSYETSWNFSRLPLQNPSHRQPTLKATYQNLRSHWREMTQEMQRLEEENNRIFIEAYGLQNELFPDVPLNEITLTCNPHYRYGNDKSEEELEALLLADTMRELVSYAVGCMFGRYSLDKPGLILANQGETIQDYLKRVPEPSFQADTDNVIPMLDDNWFPDDIAERFRTFLKTVFGDEQFEPNLKFIEKAFGKNIRKYFLKDFYTDHIKRYKKRPIYWLFSSPKGSFNALIYMHRYRPDTVSTVLQYLRDFRSKLTNHVLHLRRVEASADVSKGEKTKALKDIDAYSKVIAELDAYERDTLYPLATEQISIDLDDGVKVNYTKFGYALKKIPGLDAKEE
jgi:type II restriction/modification system DNA methylase subunit YeeA